MKLLNNIIQNNFFKGHNRTVKAKKNIIISFGLKGMSIVVSFIFVPLILGYLDAERYGIWLTLSSIIAWFSFFDIGLGNGLRNRFAEAVSAGNHELAKIYVSTTYAILGVVFLVIIILYNIINPFLNWQIILNTTTINNRELTIIALVVFIFFILRFFFKLIGSILMADQKPAISNALGPIGNVIALGVIFILTKTTEGSLLLLSIVLSVVPVIVLIIATFYFFSKDYNKYKPEFKFVDFSKSKDLLGLGFKFFYFQTGALIFFSATNFLIVQISDPQSVTQYNIAYKYFSIALMIYGIVLTPFWSAVTEAYSKKDFIWIKRILKKLNLLSLVMAGVLIILLFASNFFYNIWIGDKVSIPFNLSIIIMIYMIIQILVAPFSTFINGFGKLKMGLYAITVKLIVYIPCAIILGKQYGAFGIVLAMAIIQLPSLILESLQVYYIINQKAKGIWNE